MCSVCPHASHCCLVTSTSMISIQLISTETWIKWGPIIILVITMVTIIAIAKECQAVCRFLYGFSYLILRISS